MGNFTKILAEYLIVHTDKGEMFLNVNYTENNTLILTSFAELKLFELNKNYEIVEYNFSIKAIDDLKIYTVERQILLSEIPVEVIDYKTFRNASAATFIRFEDAGIFAGFANPFCNAEQNGKKVSISFEAALILKKGDVFEFDEAFLGSYKIEGEKLYERTPKAPLGSKETLYMTRYHNPSSLYPLYWTEIRSFQKFSHKYLAPSADKFIYEYYMYFSPVVPQPNTLKDEYDYYKYIDNFAKMSGDIIVFQPLQRQTTPSLNGKQYWEVYKEDSIGERIVKYAKSKGLKYGIYMGSAQENMEYCNSPMNIYVDKTIKPNWKKVDKNNQLTNENCICCDEFMEWYFNAQKNTILKYEMDFWNWDPGLGNGYFCYSDKHGHIPGKGAYKGFKNTQKILKQIKELERDVYLQAFHGMKEYGLWGMKYFDQHEAYWEQDPGFFATSYSDFSADRITANGMRLQAWWNMNYRFLPAMINHSLTNRMIQNCYNPDEYLRYLFDFQGYEFALMSALACGASITSPIIPYQLESKYLNEYIEFYNKWISWARDNFKYLKEGLAFGSQPDLVKIDAYSRIIFDKGFIFICNGNPIASKITFPFDETIGFMGNKKYNLKQIYPSVEYYFDEFIEKGVFENGDRITISCPENTIRLFEIVENVEPNLYGIDGYFEMKTNNSIYLITEPYNKETTKEIILSNINLDIKNIYVNNEKIEFIDCKEYIKIGVLYGNKSAKHLTFNKMFNNGIITLNNNFNLDPEVYERLNYYKHFIDMDIIERNKNPYNMQFSWTNPSRLYLVITFKEAEDVSFIKVLLNEKIVNVEEISNFAITKDVKTCYIADLTDFVNYIDENNLKICIDESNIDNFINAYLVYPKLSKTTEVTSYIDNIELNDEFLISNPVLMKSNVKNNGIKIIFAEIENFKSYSTISLKVKVNCSHENVKKILCSCPIIIDSFCRFTMNTDRELEYNPNSQLWETSFYVGNRRLTIIDDKDIHIRAIDNNGYADDYVLDIDWVDY